MASVVPPVVLRVVARARRAARLPAAALVVMALTTETAAQVDADFTATPTQGLEPLTVTFTDTTTGGVPWTGWLWDFGDGTLGIGPNPTKTYLAPGVFTVSLTVTFGAGLTDTETKVGIITVNPVPVDVDFDASPTQGANPLEVAFTYLPTKATATAWSWVFGDGGTSTLENPTHTYTAPGTYSVSLNVTFEGGASDTATKTDLITVNPAPLVVDFTASPVQGSNPLDVAFTDTSTGATVTAWSWDLGDGGTSTQQHPTHTYTAPGTYTVTLTASVFQQSETLTQTDLVTVDPAPLVVDFTASPTQGLIPLEVAFTVTSTGATVTAWSWDFGDGGTSTLQHPTHTYIAPGTYTVSLTASVFQQNETLVQTDLITVDPAPLVVDFTASPIQGDTPLLVDFTNTSTGATATGWSWDFGDGNSSTQKDPTHVYTVPGTYDVSLTGFVFQQSETVVQTDVVNVAPGLAIAQQAYVKASNTDALDQFGYSVDVDGDTMLVGAWREDSNATGVNGDESNNLGITTGAAYVFVRNGTTWTQQAYLKASNPDNGDRFGASVAISGDTIVVGADREDSGASGVDGNQLDNSIFWAGAAYVFVRNGTTWSQQGYLKSAHTEQNSGFGSAVAVSGDTVVVGASSEAIPDVSFSAGRAHVYVREGTTWRLQASLAASNPESQDQFGDDVAISDDTLVVGASREESSATGVNGNQHDNSADDSGAAYVFVRSGDAWTQQAYLKASNTGAQDQFGFAVAVSGDTVVVGAAREESSATGVDGDEDDDSADDSGAAYVFVRDGTNWSQQAYLKASNAEEDDRFGYSVAVSGETVVVGARDEASKTDGVDGNPKNNDTDDAGAAYVFLRSGTTWGQRAYLKASNSGLNDEFGRAVAMSGSTIVVGAPYENSGATGLNGDESLDNASDAGAVYVFDDVPVTWLDLGGGTASSTGKPKLVGSGTLIGGTAASVTLTKAPPNASMLGWIAFAPTPFPAVGGVVHAFPFDVQLALTADASGKFTGSTTWPTGVPPNTEVWFQFVIQDLSTTHGITLSNGLKATTP